MMVLSILVAATVASVAEWENPDDNSINRLPGVWGQSPREVMVFDGCGLFSAN